MFDAKSLLETLVKGALAPSQPQGQAGQGGGLGDLLGKVLQGGGGAPSGGQQGGGGGLGDILGQLGRMSGAGQGGAAQPGVPAGGGIEDMLRKMMPGAGQGGAQPQGQTGGGGLGDILGQLGKMAGGQGQQGGAGGGGLMDILGQVLGQATQGVKEGAQRVDQSTGASGHMRDVLGKVAGQNPDDLLAKLKELIEQNKVGAAATAGGLGGLVLGTRTGRSAAASAAKLGALVMIGGLAYKAYQNYSQGRPILDAGHPAPGALGLTAAPSGSGFEPDAITNDTATLYIRAMIGAAAADGRIDKAEQAQIMGGLQQAGLDQQARTFIEQEIQAPATPEQLAAAVSSPHEAVQVFTAARIAIELDTQSENDYLVDLAQRLGLDGDLVAHIDAEAARLTAA